MKQIFILASMWVSLFLLSGFSVEDLKIPQNFHIDIYQADIENPRQMAYGKTGILYVGSRRAGNVYAVVDKDGDFQGDEVYVVAEGLRLPSGISYYKGNLYVAAVNRVLMYENIDKKYNQKIQPKIITDALPRDTHHGWKYIKFSPQGKLFVPIGAPCNVCRKENPLYASIIELDVKSGKHEIYAQGIRNSVGFAWSPQKQLWFTDNGRDWLGDDLPPDELNFVLYPKQHFGFPFVYGDNQPDPQFGRFINQKYSPPAHNFPAHVAPLGMTFYTGDSFPKKYHNQVFVAEHGSWNRSEKVGYKVSLVSLENNKVISYSDFVSGWLKNGEVYGRPADILQLPDGSLLISDDYGNIIYRLYYTQQQ